MKKSTLFGTIISRKSFPNKVLREILETLDITTLFAFEMVEKGQFLVTFNLDNEKISTKLEVLKKKYPSTFPLHRKKRNNIFFTINSLNRLETKKKYLKDFENCIILSEGEDDVSIVKLNLTKIINL